MLALSDLLFLIHSSGKSQALTFGLLFKVAVSVYIPSILPNACKIHAHPFQKNFYIIKEEVIDTGAHKWAMCVIISSGQ